MPAPFTLEATAAEATHEVTLPLGVRRGKSLRAIDLKPGTPAIVRSATLLMKSGAAAPEGTGRVGAGPIRGGGAGGASPRADGASLVARIVYKRTWNTKVRRSATPARSACISATRRGVRPAGRADGDHSSGRGRPFHNAAAAATGASITVSVASAHRLWAQKPSSQ